MSATVRLNDRAAISFDAVRETTNTRRGVLLALEGRTHGDILNCAIIPLDRIGAVIASLQLVAAQAENA